MKFLSLVVSGILLALTFSAVQAGESANVQKRASVSYEAVAAGKRDAVSKHAAIFEAQKIRNIKKLANCRKKGTCAAIVRNMTRTAHNNSCHAYVKKHRLSKKFSVSEYLKKCIQYAPKKVIKPNVK